MRKTFLWSTPWSVGSDVVAFMLVGLRTTVAGFLSGSAAHPGYLLRMHLLWPGQLAGGLTTLFIANSVGAQTLPVLHQGQGGVPLGPYMVQTLSANDEPGTSALISLPIRSSLAPGVMLNSGTWPNSRWISGAFFVMGADDRSVRWLHGNKQQLLSIGATGLVVAVETEVQFKTLEKIADGIVLMPWSSPWLETTLKQINGGVYPVLIRADGRLTQTLNPEGGTNE